MPLGSLLPPLIPFAPASPTTLHEATCLALAHPGLRRCLSNPGISRTNLAIRWFSLEFGGGKWFLGRNECPA